MFNLLLDDLRAKSLWLYGDTSRRSLVKTCLTDGTMAMLLYRSMQAAQKCRLGLIAMALGKLNAVFCQCVIGRRADFGPGFVLVHSQGLVINSGVRGGAAVTLEHQVTIGAEKGKAPLLGDRVFVGAGAKILGGVTVGDDVRVGANAVVVADVPPGATVVGVPARVVRVYGKAVAETAAARSEAP